ncbi:hypothetical protein [Streptomyces sp. NRRL B-1347]|uniref:hypothetical protein n=1 Tax=Streptomyces sp. NRRL B-1347 TaxID=1476877 RepID=UPI0004C64F43|nr:hypothetical protein [Streptomyces sp. NRRL B-1347]
MTSRDQRRAHAALLLVSRLISRHNLTHAEACRAVVHRQRNETGPHTHLVDAEALALAEEAMAPLRAMIQAAQPHLRALTTAVVDLVRAFEQLNQQKAHASRQGRPAWESPYGPPPRRTR